MAEQQSKTPDYSVQEAVAPDHKQKSSAVEDQYDIPKRRVVNDCTFYKPVSTRSEDTEIRLIGLIPAESDDDELECGIFNLDAAGHNFPYVALSYCWGDLGEQRTISLKTENEIEVNPKTLPRDIESAPMDGEGEEKPQAASTTSVLVKLADSPRQKFNVTASLYSALKSVRHLIPVIESRISCKGGLIPIWIDAICINQDDADERNSQVGKMGSIYSGARIICVSLDEDEALGIGFDMIQRTIGLLTGEFGDALQLWNPKQEHIEWLFDVRWKTDNGDVIGPEGFVQVIERFFSNPYFRRIWVLQEATIRAERTYILRGDFILPWSWFITIDRFRQFYRQKRPNTQTVGHLPQIWTSKLQQRLIYYSNLQDQFEEGDSIPQPDDVVFTRPLFSLFLDTYEQFNATDLRDKVFALLDISSETYGDKKLTSDLLPNYNESVSQVYIKFTRWCLRQYGDLELLSRLSEGPRRVFPDNPIANGGEHMPSGCLDARQHPSWAVWPISGQDWAAKSLYTVRQDKNSRYGLASRHEVQLCDPSVPHDVWKVPSSISSRLLGLRGKRMGSVRLKLGLVFQRYRKHSPGFVRLSATGSKPTDWPESENEFLDTSLEVQLVDSNTNTETNERGRVGLGNLWSNLDRNMISHPKGNFDRYIGKSELMFRDFLETLLLTHVVRDVDADDHADDNSLLLDGPWDDPDIALSFGMESDDWGGAGVPLPPRIKQKISDITQSRGGLVPEQQFAAMFHGEGRCWFMTSDQRMGMCCRDVLPGDIIVALYGSAVPFVLRPVGSDTEAAAILGENLSLLGDEESRKHMFRFVGDCFVHNRMSSSYFDHSPDIGEPETFYLY